MLDLRKTEPELFSIKELDDGKEIETIVEIVPLLTEDIEITLDFMEYKDKLDVTRKKAEAKALIALKKGKKSKKQIEEIKANNKGKIPISKEDKKEVDTIIFTKLLPVMNEMVDKGLVRNDNPEIPVSLPRRYRTMPNLMKIATKILEVTSEGDEDNSDDSEGDDIPLEQKNKS